ncbi:MAG TPA: hypothetical protein VD735_01225 [Candidatus Saccharimonadales bacterium]|nr:hypothetical protein [Candidatus Saccharimonadales bacterium]
MRKKSLALATFTAAAFASGCSSSGTEAAPTTAPSVASVAAEASASPAPSPSRNACYEISSIPAELKPGTKTSRSYTAMGAALLGYLNTRCAHPGERSTMNNEESDSNVRFQLSTPAEKAGTYMLALSVARTEDGALNPNRIASYSVSRINDSPYTSFDAQIVNKSYNTDMFDTQEWTLTIDNEGDHVDTYTGSDDLPVDPAYLSQIKTVMGEEVAASGAQPPR